MQFSQQRHYNRVCTKYCQRKMSQNRPKWLCAITRCWIIERSIKINTAPETLKKALRAEIYRHVFLFQCWMPISVFLLRNLWAWRWARKRSLGKRKEKQHRIKCSDIHVHSFLSLSSCTCRLGCAHHYLTGQLRNLELKTTKKKHFHLAAL